MQVSVFQDIFLFDHSFHCKSIFKEIISCESIFDKFVSISSISISFADIKISSFCFTSTVNTDSENHQLLSLTCKTTS